MFALVLDMRYIKTFEGFYHEADMVREIASFLDGCSVSEYSLEGNGDTSMFRAYEVDGLVEEEAGEALSALSAMLESEHGLSIELVRWVDFDVPPGQEGDMYSLVGAARTRHLVLLTEEGIGDAIEKWMVANVGLEFQKVLSPAPRIFYVDREGKPVLWFALKKSILGQDDFGDLADYLHQDRVWVSYERGGRFFRDVLNLTMSTVLAGVERWVRKIGVPDALRPEYPGVDVERSYFNDIQTYPKESFRIVE